MNYLTDNFSNKELSALERATQRLRDMQPYKPKEKKPKDLVKWARRTVESAIMNGEICQR